MPYLLALHKVADYSRWKTAFDGDAANRKAHGSKGALLLRSAGDPNEIVVLFEWDDLGRARQFTQSANSREVGQRAGVSGKVEMYFLEELGKSPA